ncbi:MAG: 3-deoxy-7-phosphoheptulonate synthase, partial [Gammaproteobacteria bacterium]|nr:3-deoxy-7-phosphoheptulonate synthase [Gammaproteobacteria bacterium]
QGKWYNLSTHFPWVGMRTAKLGSAHIEYLRGINNPLAIKIGTSITADQLLQLIETLNPENEPGRITLISRFGAQQIGACLPPLIKAVEQSGQTVLWSCDPMHGNTRITKTGLKTRDIEAIHEELKLAFQIHKENQSQLSAVHLEISGNNITECTGGLCQLTDAMLESNYQSLLDPRLNRAQSLEISLFIIQEILKKVDYSLYLASTGD